MIEFENPLCKGRRDFYPPEVRSDKVAPSLEARMVVDRLKAVCEACAHQRDCYEYALANKERFGVWGGVHFGDARERAAAHRRAKKLSAVH